MALISTPKLLDYINQVYLAKNKLPTVISKGKSLDATEFAKLLLNKFHQENIKNTASSDLEEQRALFHRLNETINRLIKFPSIGDEKKVMCTLYFHLRLNKFKELLRLRKEDPIPKIATISDPIITKDSIRITNTSSESVDLSVDSTSQIKMYTFFKNAHSHWSTRSKSFDQTNKPELESYALLRKSY